MNTLSLSGCRVSHSDVRPHTIKVTIPLWGLEVSRPTSADLSWSSPAPWPPAGSPGCPSRRASPPSWTRRMRTAPSAPCPPCPPSPLPPPPPPPHPPPTPSPPRPLAPPCLQRLPAADWGLLQLQATRPAGAGGTARSLSRTPASPSAWMTTASGPLTSSFNEVCRVLVPALKKKWMWLVIIVFPANEVTLWTSASISRREFGAPCWSKDAPSWKRTEGRLWRRVFLVQLPQKTWIISFFINCFLQTNYGTCFQSVALGSCSPPA